MSRGSYFLNPSLYCLVRLVPTKSRDGSKDRAYSDLFYKDLGMLGWMLTTLGTRPKLRFGRIKMRDCQITTTSPASP